jgi:hypothetical protein
VEPIVHTVDDSSVVEFDSFLVRVGREILIVALISAVGLAIRFPFFFPAKIDWDESTFVLAGQSAVDGFLPYEIAWEAKPALMYWWFGAAIELFGKTIPGVRFAGFLWLVLSAYILYWAAFLISGSRLGAFFGAAMLIVASSAYAEHVSTEHLAELPTAGAILVLCNGDRRPRSVFVGGSLLGLACMFRLNLVYLGLCVGAFLCVSSYHRPWQSFFREALQRAVWFTTGILTPAFLSFLPYLLTGRSQLSITFYEAAVSYSHDQLSLARNVVAMLGGLSIFVGTTMWGVAALGAFNISSRWRELSQEQRSNWLLSGVIVLGSSLSVIFTGPFYKHYLVQLVPGLSIFSAAAFVPRAKAAALSKTEYVRFAVGCVLIALSIFWTAAAEWRALSQRLRAGVPLSYGIEYEIADFLKSQGSKDLSLFMLDNHLVYWLLDRYAPTLLATHPANVSAPFLRKIVEPDSDTTEDALRSVFRRNPCFVVGPPNPWYLDAASNRFVQQEMAANYAVVGHIRSVQVFGRIGSVQVYRRIAHARAEASALEREQPGSMSVHYCGE